MATPDLIALSAIADFLGDGITDEQTLELADRAKRYLGKDEYEEFMANHAMGPLYTECSMHKGEMGWS